MVKAVKAGQWYALKTLLAKPEIDLTTQIRLFYHEGTIMQEIHHHRIPKCLELFELHETHFMVQEFIPGTPLSTLMENGYAFSEDEIKQITLQLLEILSVLHTQGVVHRDLRLSNLMLDGDKLFVVDFGFARKFTNQPQQQPFPLPDPLHTNASSSYLALRRAISPGSDFFGVGLVAIDLASNCSGKQNCYESPFYQSFIKTLLKAPDSIPSANDAIEKLLPML